MMNEAEKLDGLNLAYQNTQDVMLLCPKKCIDENPMKLSQIT